MPHKDPAERAAYLRAYREANAARLKAYHERWRADNPDHEYRATARARLKLAAIELYGGECGCCKEPNPAFLTIDHINGGGGAHRKQYNNQSAYYRAVIAENDRNAYQVQCYNCNCGRQANGGVCPHEEEGLNA